MIFAYLFCFVLRSAFAGKAIFAGLNALRGFDVQFTARVPHDPRGNAELQRDGPRRILFTPAQKLTHVRFLIATVNEITSAGGVES
jgi:hypothetical protein